MNRRLYDFEDMCNETHDNRVLCENCSENGEVMVPNCIDTEFCLTTPRNINNGILTIAFVDMQPLDSVYPVETAFCNGTLFPNIDKPFFGGRKR